MLGSWSARSGHSPRLLYCLNPIDARSSPASVPAHTCSDHLRTKQAASDFRSSWPASSQESLYTCRGTCICLVHHSHLESAAQTLDQWAKKIGIEIIHLPSGTVGRRSEIDQQQYRRGLALTVQRHPSAGQAGIPEGTSYEMIRFHGVLHSSG
jgi:hypothetical protein